MKRFLKHAGLIILSVFILMVVLDVLYTTAFLYSSPRKKIHRILQTEDLHYNFVFFGSSRTENHIDCELFEKLTGKTCLNMGLNGSGIDDMLFLLKIANQQNFTFDQAVIQMDFNYNETGTDSYFISNLMPFIQNQVVRKEVLKGPRGFYYSYIPFYRYMAFDKIIGFRELFATVLNVRPTIDPYNGFWPLTHKKELIETRLPERPIDSNPTLEKSVELIKLQGGNVLFFTAPFCALAEVNHFMDGLEKEIPGLYNYSTLYNDKPEFFVDCLHLNKTGAQAFTAKFIKDLKRDKFLTD